MEVCEGVFWEGGLKCVFDFVLTTGWLNDFSFHSLHWHEDLGVGTRFRGQKALWIIVLTVQEDGPTRLSRKAGSWECPRWELLKSNSWGASLPGHGNSHMKNTLSNLFPPVLQSPLVTLNSSGKTHLPPSWEVEL